MNRIMSAVKNAIEYKASDIHLSAGISPILRINGELQKSGYLPLEDEVIEAFISEIASSETIEDYKENGESDFSQVIFHKRFRINIFKEKGNNAIVMRLIGNNVPDIDHLGLPAVLKTFSKKKNGLILVAGPTGSGKSTTMAAIINEINKNESRSIVTLEDPIEFLFKNAKSLIKQREVGKDTKSFSRGIKAALRQDPDVIMIGEMRDSDTISAALTAAETGHLVISTLHTTGAENSINRIIDGFPAYQQEQVKDRLSLVLEGIVSQKLLMNSEKSGLVGAFEILTVNNAVRNLIREGKSHEIRNIIQTNSKSEMITMDMYLERLVRNNIISQNTAIEHMVEER